MKTDVCRISRLPLIEGEKIVVFILRGVPFPYEDGDHWERLIVCPPIFGKYDSKDFIKDIYPDSFTLNILKRAFAIEDDDEDEEDKIIFDYSKVADIIFELNDVPDCCYYRLDDNGNWGDWGDSLSVFAIKKEVYNKIISIYKESSIYEKEINELKQHIHEDFCSDNENKDEDWNWFYGLYSGYPDWLYRVSSENYIYTGKGKVLIDKQLLENRLIQGYEFKAGLELLRTSFDPGTDICFDWVDVDYSDYDDEDRKKYELEIYRAIYKFNNFIASLSIREYSKYKNISLEEAEKLITNNDNQDGQNDSK